LTELKEKLLIYQEGVKLVVEWAIDITDDFIYEDHDYSQILWLEEALN
jgi:hypothetical protein